MTVPQLHLYRNHLLDLATRFQGTYTRLRDEALRGNGGDAGGNLSNLPLHIADLATDSFEQTMALNLLENKGIMLDQAVEALDRIDNGTYGFCLECQREIPDERLQALPYTPYCVTCAQALQRAGR